MADAVRAERFGILLAVMVAVLLVVPPLAGAGHGALASRIVIPALIVAGTVAVGGRRGLPAGAAATGAAALGAEVLHHAVSGLGPAILVQGLYTAFLLLVIADVLRRVLRTGRVTANTILAGVCGYLLVGLLFHGVYVLLDSLWPGSFRGPGLAAAGGAGRGPELLYFSFVTLTTLGFGDVTPAHPLAGMLATLEAVAGQLYLAILIASLVGVALAQRQDRAA